MSDQKDLICPVCSREYSVPDVEGTWYCWGGWHEDHDDEEHPETEMKEL